MPDGVLGFKLAVDPTTRDSVYAATGGGLFRSTDAGASFTNVNLPTGERAADADCSGKPPTAKDCFLANMVTDVVVQGAGQRADAGRTPSPAPCSPRSAGAPAQATNADGAQQSPGNGIYRSDTGAPGTFKNLDIAGNSTPIPPDPLTQARIGRIALGIADGADQDHRVVYALVQDAVKFNGGVAGLDANENGTTSAAQSDYLNGIWVSTDFGTDLEAARGLDDDRQRRDEQLGARPADLQGAGGRSPTARASRPGTTSGSRRTRRAQTAAGVPTRLAFGLEEVWANDPTATPRPASTARAAEVQGRRPLLRRRDLHAAQRHQRAAGLPGRRRRHRARRPRRIPTSTARSGCPTAGGGVTLFVGNDGGVYKQHLGARRDARPTTQAGARGANNGLNTLQPYDAAMAKDGTVYMGLQDNGEAKIEPDGNDRTRSSAATASSPRSIPTTRTSPTRSTSAATSSVTTDGGKTWTDIQPANLDQRRCSRRRSRWTRTTRTT